MTFPYIYIWTVTYSLGCCFNKRLNSSILGNSEFANGISGDIGTVTGSVFTNKVSVASHSKQLWVANALDVFRLRTKLKPLVTKIKYSKILGFSIMPIRLIYLFIIQNRIKSISLFSLLSFKVAENWTLPDGNSQPLAGCCWPPICRVAKYKKWLCDPWK